MLFGMRTQQVCYRVNYIKWCVDVMCEMALLHTFGTLEKPESNFAESCQNLEAQGSGPITFFSDWSTALFATSIRSIRGTRCDLSRLIKLLQKPVGTKAESCLFHKEV